MVNGVIGAGGLGESCKHSALGKIQIFRLFAKVCEARFLEPIGTMAEVNCIEVEFKNLVFRIIFSIWTARASSSILRRMVRSLERKYFYRLLRDGTAAFQGMPCEVVCDSRPGDADRIYSAVLVEAAVLGGDDSFFRRSGISFWEINLFLSTRASRDSLK